MIKIKKKSKILNNGESYDHFKNTFDPLYFYGYVTIIYLLSFGLKGDGHDLGQKIFF